MKMIYPDADERLVNGVILHASADKAALTYDEEGKEKVLTADLVDMFVKGLAVIKLKGADPTYLKPTACVEKTGVATVSCAIDSSATAKTYTFVSTKAAA